MILTLAMLATLSFETGIVEIRAMSDEQASIIASNQFVIMSMRDPVNYNKKFKPVSAIEILLKEVEDVSDCSDC